MRSGPKRNEFSCVLSSEALGSDKIKKLKNLSSYRRTPVNSLSQIPVKNVGVATGVPFV